MAGDFDEAHEELVPSAVMGVVERFPKLLDTCRSLAEDFLYTLETRFRGVL
jgi:hypothetical protein